MGRKKMGKKKATTPPPEVFEAAEVFLDWMKSEDGHASQEALDLVHESLEGADLDPKDRKIIWPDGSRRTVKETADRIAKKSSLPLPKITGHVIGWLEMGWEPKKKLSEYQRGKIEEEIDAWIGACEKELPPKYGR